MNDESLERTENLRSMMINREDWKAFVRICLASRC